MRSLEEIRKEREEVAKKLAELGKEEIEREKIESHYLEEGMPLITIEVDVEALRANSRVAQKFKDDPSLLLPVRQRDGDAGYDLIYPYDDGFDVHGNTVYVINTFLKTNIPEGYCALGIIRSSVGTKGGLEISNGTSLIDAGYKGHIKIPVNRKGVDNIHYLDTSETIPIGVPRINPDDRICQLVFTKHEITSNDKVVGGKRDKGGFGSTDKK